ncbi:secretin N-terminal domain-containing protein [Alienimonas chondri]|nr:secretin N-terminal domain-containing protein [Alienimonas chondri]
MICLTVAALFCSERAPAFAQTAASTVPGLTAATRAKLNRRITLTLPGVPLREALMSVREVAELNLVINQELAGTVDVSFRDAPVHEVLDTLLLSRGLGYRPVGDGLVVVPIADLGAGNPLLASEVFSTPSVDPIQLLPIVEEMLSPEGRAHAMTAGRSLVVFDYPARIDAIRTQVERLDAAAASRTSVEEQAAAARLLTVPSSRGPGGRAGAGDGQPLDSVVVRLLYVPAAEMAVALAPLLGENGRVSAMDNEDRLLVVDSPANLRAIQSAMQSLDVPRVQVRIRALIYDCAIEDGRDLGLNWGGSLRGRSFAADGTPMQSIAFSGVTAAGVVNPTAAGAVVAAATASRYLDLTSTLRALNESKDSRLLADPNVVVLNHERADIKIVTEVPYQELTQSALGGAIGTTSFREAGVRLEVTPHIAPDRTVTMLVHPEFSVLSGFTPETNAPIIDTREATTTVRIADRETLVLGGLRQRSKVRTKTSLPFFGAIPVAGRLFRQNDFEVRESELLVFLTPEIVGPCYSGDYRETGVAVFGHSELEATPLHPQSMGTDAALREDRCAWDNCHFDKALRRGPWGTSGEAHCDLPAEVFAAPVVTGLIGPEYGESEYGESHYGEREFGEGAVIPPAPAPPSAPHWSEPTYGEPTRTRSLPSPSPYEGSQSFTAPPRSSVPPSARSQNPSDASSAALRPIPAPAPLAVPPPAFPQMGDEPSPGADAAIPAPF